MSSDLFHPDGDGIPFDPVKQAKKASKPVLPKRFYKTASVEEAEKGFQVVLDGRSVKTPARNALTVSSKETIGALCDEWNAQLEFIDPSTMPLTRILNAAIDGVEQAKPQVREEIAKFAETDLLCYRADQPERLVEKQTEHWDPVLRWFEEQHGARFNLAAGIMHVEQSAESLQAVGQALNVIQSSVQLASLHTITGLTGSALLSLALHASHIDEKQAWAAAHVDEDWNIELWGEDDEAKARRAYRWQEMQAACLLLKHEV